MSESNFWPTLGKVVIWLIVASVALPLLMFVIVGIFSLLIIGHIASL